MKISNWYDTTKPQNENIRGEVTLLPGGAEIKLKDIHSVGAVTCDVEGFTPDKYISADVRILLNGTVKSAFYASWYKDGEEIFVEYIKEAEKIIPCEGADLLKISVMVYGQGGNAKISDVTVLEGEEIKERKAVVASLSIPYGFVWEHRIRTCEDNVRDSLERIDALVKEDKRIDLIVLTETFNSRITSGNYDESFITLESDHIKRMRNKAAEHGIYLSFSFREKTAEGGNANSAILIDRKGEIAAYYRKCHLTLSEKLAGLTPGNEIVVCDTDFGRVGFAICWDLFYPETARMLVKKGAELIINPTAGYSDEMHCQRAADSGAYIVTGGVWGNNCSVITPEGKIVSNGAMMGAAVAEIDFNKRYPVKYLAVNSYAERRNVYYREIREDLF